MVLSILEAVQDLHREGEERADGPQGVQLPEGFPQEAAHHRRQGCRLQQRQ